MSNKYCFKEVRIRLAEGDVLYSTSPIANKDSAVDTLKGIMTYDDCEKVYVVNLDNKLRPINYSVVASGSMNACYAGVASIFKSAILSSASCVMVLHNHPSGDPTPSKEDADFTSRIADAGKLLGIKLIDHVVVGSMTGCTYSFREKTRLLD